MRLTRCKGSMCLLLAALSWGGSAEAQVIYNNASTVGESYARGMADVISAHGEYNLMTSQAAVNLTEANRRDIENREAWTRAYFEMRAINRNYRDMERGPRPTTEDLVRFAQIGKPERLTPSQLDYVTGRIAWPKVLTIPPYHEYRQDLEILFERRSRSGGLGYDDQIRVRNIATLMLADLQAHITEFPPSDYMTGKRFLESLSYEAQLPTS